MRFATFRCNGSFGAGIVDGEEVVVCEGA
ncbi:Rv2993c-like domain-containing protein [Chelativorans salis]